MRDLIPWRRKTDISRFSDDPFVSLHREMNHLFDRFFEGEGLVGRSFFDQEGWYPKVDVSEGKKNVTVKAELPGVTSKEIDVSLDGRTLTIKGEKKDEKETKENNYHHVERSYGYFNRSIELPADVDPDSVDASYKKGVLKIELKKTKASESKTIKVKSD